MSEYARTERGDRAGATTVAPFRWANCGLFVLTVVLLLGACTSPPPSDPATATGPDWVTIVDSARWAQNAHNMQSWRLRVVSPREIVGGLDPARLLPETDPLGRQLVLSLGALSEAARVAARDDGWRLTVEWIAPEDWSFADDPGAELFRWRAAPAADDAPTGTGGNAVDSTAAAGRRPTATSIDALSAPTVKFRVRPMVLGDDAAAELEQVYDAPGARWQIETGTERVSETLAIAAEAFEIEMRHEPTLMESYDVTRIGGRAIRREPYGLTLRANIPRGVIGIAELALRLFPASPERYAETGIDMFNGAIEGSETLVVLTTDANTPKAQFHAGMPLQALWMDVIIRGGSLLPLSQGLQEYPEVAELYERLHELWAESGETVQMIMSLGEPRGRFRRGPRIPAEEVFVGYGG